MHPFDHVVLIFNPHSTGTASGLRHSSGTSLSGGSQICGCCCSRPSMPGTHAIWRWKRRARGLCSCRSADGGYNEVVDGAMQSGSDAVVCAVLPAGNANDQRRATREQPRADAIVAGSVTRIDLLRLTVEGSSPNVRCAHSYIGLAARGLGPQPSVREYRFTNLEQMPIQVDGEVMEVK